ncbi:AMP-binding protein [Azospirillum sp. YIM B02556]|uniref:AMP-binding protein n=1 Tax=Azospirillum endophyticum TaxID=2800326 RepID=A0ABS1FBJ3_9PROT|nr:AMP-binding protein [Azospirillum endophyticum]MBK1840795.1 AMP-binding protein [Azospirillum endophyticum]
MDTVLDHLRAHGTRSDTVFCHFVRNGMATVLRFGDVLDGGTAYAHHFRRCGLQPGDIVLIVLRHTPDLLQAFVGALIAGCVPSILAPLTEKQSPDVYWPGLRRMFDRVGARALVVAAADQGGVIAAAGSKELVIVDPDQVPADTRPFEWPDVRPDDVAFLQFSSGTTGLRKGVMLTHRAVLEQVEAYRAAIGLGVADRIASWLPLYHDMGLVACFVMPLVLGIPIVLLDPMEWARQPGILFRWIEETKATHVWLPNFAFNHLRLAVGSDERYDLGSVKAFINCSEPCKAATFDQFLQRFGSWGVGSDRLTTCYAMAEAVFAVTQSPLGAPPVRLMASAKALAFGRIEPGDEDDSLVLLSVGKPIDGMAVHILDDARQPLAAGRVGEIALSASFLFTGYHSAPEDTAAAFQDGLYLTGDLGFIQDGELFITGRRKDVIIVNGRNYYAHDIEALAATVEGVIPGRLVALGLMSQATMSEEVVVLAECADPDPAARRAVVRALKSTLLRGLNLSVRAELVAPRWLIKTTSGKIARGENLERYLTMNQNIRISHGQVYGT